MSDQLIGTRLGQYEITEAIAQGGMAMVYKAYQETLDRIVAIKVLGYGADRQFADRFKREARAMAALQHPNILPIYDYGEVGNVLYLAIQYVENGRTLHDLIGNGPMPPLAALRLLRRVCDALQYAHERGVVHRDIKPGNILLPSDTWPMLSDFGIAKLLGDGQTKLTQANQVIGTAAYMAPEQATGRTVDARTDLYAVGIMLYEAVTGRVPFDDTTPMAVLVKHIYNELPPPRLINPNLPVEVEALIQRALEKDPAARFQTAAEMAEAIDHVVDQLDSRNRRTQHHTLYQIGVQAFQQARWDEAIDQLGRLVAVDPNYSDARMLLDAARTARSGTNPNLVQVPPTTGAAPTPVQPVTQAPTPVQPVTQAPTPVQPVTQAPTPVQPVTQAPTPVQPVTQAPTPVQPTPAPARRIPLGLLIGGGIALLALIAVPLFLLRGGGPSASNPTAASQPTSAGQPTSAPAPTTASQPSAEPAVAPTDAGATPNPVPDPVGSLVLQNDFQDNTIASGLEDNLRATDFQRGIHAPGFYHMLLYGPNDTRVALLPQGLYRDFNFQIDLKDNSDSTIGTVTQGLVFRARDAQHYYALLIDPRAGKFSLLRQDGNRTSELIPWTASPLIQLGDAINRLRIDAAGDEFRFYMNGGELASFGDQSYQQGLLGFIMANADAEKPHMHWDNLAVWSDPSPPPAPELPAQREDPNGNMVLIPAGEFVMGSNQSSNAPVHVVNLPSFYLDRTEVTNAAYQRCVADGKCAEPRQKDSPTHPDYYGNPQYAEYPVMLVTWEQARTFCEYAGKRLPSEAEWEKAAGWDAQKSHKLIFPWGDTFQPELLNSSESGNTDTTQVGQFAPELNGLVDLAGNVSEWTNSLQQPYPYDEADGREENPAPGERIFRGGSWAQTQGKARVASRQAAATDYPSREIGFRCALTP